MTKRSSGRSSRSTKPPANRCPECGEGALETVIVSRTYSVEGRKVRIDGLMPLECTACHERLWPEAEAERASRAVAVKLRRAAA